MANKRTTAGKGGKRGGRRAAAPPRATPVRHPLTEAAKLRYRALVDAEVRVADIARAAGVAPATVTNVLRGRARSQDRVEPVIAEMTGLPLAELFPDYAYAADTADAA